MGNYILDDHDNPVHEPDFRKFAEYMEDNRRVAKSEEGNCTISTVFLGLDHSFGSGKPILWETMVFGVDDEYQERYTSKKAALEGHKKAVTLIKEKI